MFDLKTVKKSDLTATPEADLGAYANEQFGLSVDVDAISKSDLVELIWTKVKERRDAPEPSSHQTQKSDEETATVIFPQKENESSYIFVGYNGRQFQIPRGEEVTIPRALLNGPIKDAKSLVTKHHRNKEGVLETVSIYVPRFPYIEA